MASSVEGYKQQLQVQQEHFETRQAELNNTILQLQDQAKLEGQELEKSLKLEVGTFLNEQLFTSSNICRHYGKCIIIIVIMSFPGLNGTSNLNSFTVFNIL